ncbi:MAG: hypothetical protein A2X61_07910 [Ignavibacteria bacterium GWB2_35_12]|nr:MAG: hypothetical protein A2X63_12955 [Ignavibacteria bacterium GWA2_35_8]OGU39509.1 MAG: hypothetical protein A2X61_07910 [Ignavibacteria bacterium GWB2_35_12]OGU90145.1 MAG: hypothetical protein A2220_16145 [Ignavibacteria bacterium RIFOXYA2_FULL_35_10]OGV21879.1 MAG: hypothetical protein A2475_09650 [Ignavibacteria bacterium RIFOXYC2_FULL_35_21]
MKKLINTILLVSICTLLFTAYRATAEDFDLKKLKKELPKLLGSNNVGTEFWLTFIPCWETTGAKNDLKLYISSGVETVVTVEIPGKGYVRQQKTIPNDIIEFTLSPSIGQPYRKTDAQPPEPDDVYTGNGIHVYAEDPIIVYGVTRYLYTSDGYLGVPLSSLGKDYIVASWADPANNDPTSPNPQYLTSYTAVTAAYDQTRVRFTLGGTSSTRTAGNMTPGETKQWILYKGDVLLFGSIGKHSDLSGSRIRANKPVSVISGSFCAYIPENTPACDFIIEMELPTHTWGTEYHVTKIIDRLKNSFIKIFPKESGTKIYRDGIQLTSLSTGGGLESTGWLRMRVDQGDPRPIIISGDKPISVTQYNPGQLDDGIYSDPFQLILTPLEQYQREIVFNTPGIKGGSGFTSNYINLVYRAADDGTIPDDLEFAHVQGGVFIWKKLSSIDPNPGQQFSILVNGKKYYCKTITLPGDGVYKIRANDPFAAYAYGFSSFDSYGFPTSVALGDLEKPDTIPPDPIWILECDGTIKGATVEDMPRNNDRSNLSQIILLSEQSFNYKMTYKDFMPGEDASTEWKAWVVDKNRDGRAVIIFTDRRGNDTIITINYYAVKLAIRPDLDFGMLPIGAVVEKDAWVINESSQSAVMLDSLSLKYNNQGFEVFGLNLPYLLQPLDSVPIKVRFTATINGEFRDSVGVGDTCFFNFESLVKANVGSAIINVTYHDFGDVVVNHTANGQIEIRNNGNIDLVITGYTVPRQPVIFIPDIVAISEPTPLVIKPNDVFTYEVTFIPPAEQRYTDSMFFISNTEKVNNPDSVGDLFGRGIKPGLAANSYDWGRRRIDRTAFPSGPYDPDNNYDVIKLENNGSSAVTIWDYKIISDINGTAFEFDRGLLTNRQIQDSSFIIVPVKFHPVVTGQHALIIVYENSAGDSTQTILRGIGIVPRVETSDVDFGETVINDTLHPNIRQVRFTNLSPIDWDYGDSLIIEDLIVQPAGNVISENMTVFGTEGFKYDKSAITFPLTLRRGEHLDFDAQFVANKIPQANGRLLTKSDAENEVISNWFGKGIAQGLNIETGTETICVYDTVTIACRIYNIGSNDISVDSLEIQPLDAESATVFSFVNLADEDGFVIPAGLYQTVLIKYSPVPITTPIPRLTIHRANLVAYNNSVASPVVTSAIPVTGNAEFYGRNSTIIPKKQTNKIGDTTYVSLNLEPGLDISLAQVRQLDITVTYNGDFLKVYEPDVHVGTALEGKFAIQNLTINDVAGIVKLSLVSTTDILNLPGGGEILRLYIGTYLPKTQTDSSDIVDTIVVPETRCVGIMSDTGKINLEPTCAYDLRKVVLNSTAYSMSKVNPNPVTNSAEIEFSVGLEALTEIKIFGSSSEVVAVPVSEVLKPGVYRLGISVQDLPSGVYWLELSSGPYKKIEKMVVTK